MSPRVPVISADRPAGAPSVQLIDEGRPGFPGPTFDAAADQQLAVGLRQDHRWEDPGPGFGHRFGVGRGDPFGPEVGIDVTVVLEAQRPVAEHRFAGA